MFVCGEMKRTREVVRDREIEPWKQMVTDKAKLCRENELSFREAPKERDSGSGNLWRVGARGACACVLERHFHFRFLVVIVKRTTLVVFDFPPLDH